MRILVTGSEGFLGRKIIKTLKKKQENEIIPVDIKNCQYQCDIADLESIENLAQKIKQVDIIIHCAAYISFSNIDEKLINSNIIGTLNIIKLCNLLECKKIIYLSGTMVVKNNGNAIINCDQYEQPRSLYLITKLTGEQILELFNEDIDVCILRIAAPIDSEMPDNRMISMFLKAAVNNEDIFINGKGSRLQTYISTDDISECISLVINKNITGKYVLDGEVYSNYEIANLCKQITSSDSVIHYGDNVVSEDNEKWIIDSTFREKILKYELRTKMTDILTEMKERYS